MIKHCFLFTITDSNGNTSTFGLNDHNIRMAYQRKKNFGVRRMPIDLELLRFETNWDNNKELSNMLTSSLNDLFEFCGDALENKPCTMTVDYYAAPVLIDVSTNEIAATQLTDEEVFTSEYFVKNLITDALMGTVGYDITPIQDILSETVTLQLNQAAVPEDDQIVTNSIVLEEGET